MNLRSRMTLSIPGVKSNRQMETISTYMLHVLKVKFSNADIFKKFVFYDVNNLFKDSVSFLCRDRGMGHRTSAMIRRDCRLTIHRYHHFIYFLDT